MVEGDWLLLGFPWLFFLSFGLFKPICALFVKIIIPYSGNDILSWFGGENSVFLAVLVAFEGNVALPREKWRKMGGVGRFPDELLHGRGFAFGGAQH